MKFWEIVGRMLAGLTSRRSVAPEPVLAPTPNVPALPFIWPVTDEDVRIAALTVWGEARGETARGRQAVAWVIRNRAEAAMDHKVRRGRNHPLFGDGSLETACLAPWQFSCWNANDPNRRFLTGETPMNQTDLFVLGECETAVRAVLAGSVVDPTFGSKHYHVKGLKVAWSADRDHAALIGNHVFFNDIA